MLDNVHGGDIKSYKLDIIDFSANINPFGLSPKTKEAIIKNITKVIHYPEPGSRSLKKAIGVFHGINEANLAVGNGSIELIHLIPRALKAKKVLVITPAFSEYEFASRISGAEVIFFRTNELENFKIDFCRLKKLLSEVDLVFLGNPNNPTGSYLDAEEMSLLIKLCESHKTVLTVDEVFKDFVVTPKKDGFFAHSSKNRFLLVLKSLTKSFALPGLRIGYAIGNRDLIKRISSLQYPWNINSLAQAAGVEALKDADYLDKSREFISGEREFLFNSLKDIKGLKSFPSSSNFILCKLEEYSIKSAKALNKKLIKKGIVVRDCSNFRGLDERFFRVAVRKRDENIKLIKALRT